MNTRLTLMALQSRLLAAMAQAETDVEREALHTANMGLERALTQLKGATV